MSHLALVAQNTTNIVTLFSHLTYEEEDYYKRVMHVFLSTLTVIFITCLCLRYSDRCARGVQYLGDRCFKKAEDPLIPLAALEDAKKIVDQAVVEETLAPLPDINNPEIATLSYLWQHSFTSLCQVMSESSAENVWNNELVLQAADKVITIAYALSSYLLKENLAVQELFKIHSFQHEALFYLPASYMAARLFCTIRSKNSDSGQVTLGLYDNVQIPKEYHAPFYQEGTLQNKWRILYNNFCRELRKRVPAKEIRKLDPRVYNWTKEEHKHSKFYRDFPDTIPNTQVFVLPAIKKQN